MRLLLGTGLLFLLASGASEGEIRGRAAKDLQCDPVQIQLTPSKDDAGKTEYGADGCGRHASYRCRVEKMKTVCDRTDR